MTNLRISMFLNESIIGRKRSNHTVISSFLISDLEFAANGVLFGDKYNEVQIHVTIWAEE